ncbi:hypothetical protein AB0K05_37095 [Nonomuraea sp. NPDC049486]|uniref:hypothetical protein n=1 Tax=unclassified Nonomuraea TaxID=2593643 RepID=UPI0011CDD7FF|nr:hypothetical protein [Nonomuraea sp. C10]TXK40067.1 hypothetical protein FR742_11150 [Nonomuraea sp. C10]
MLAVMFGWAIVVGLILGLVQLTEEQTRMVDVVIGKHLVGQARAQLVQQVVFLVLAFLLGFVVNWLSTPALDTLRGWWTT